MPEENRLCRLTLELFEALRNTCRFDAIPRVFNLLPEISKLADRPLGRGIFSVIDNAFKWEDSPEGKEYWKNLYEALSFRAGDGFRTEALKLLGTEAGLADHVAWNELEKRRWGVDTRTTEMELPLVSALGVLEVKLGPGGLEVSAKDDHWMELLLAFSEISVDYFLSRIKFESPFKVRAEDRDVMFPKDPVPDSTKDKFFLGRVRDEGIVLAPDGEVRTSKSFEIKGDWDLFLVKDKELVAERPGKPDYRIVTSFFEGANRIFRGETDLMAKACRLAFLHGKAKLDISFEQEKE